MNCKHCGCGCAKAGKQACGAQKYRCRACKKYQQAKYQRKAYESGIDAQVVAHVKEGCGIWNKNRGMRRFPRLLGIAKGTVLARIRRIASAIKPVAEVASGGSYEVDELHTFVGNKEADCYVSYAFCRETGDVVDFVVGSRTKVNLGRLTCKVLGMEPRRIFTDGLNVYPSLIPSEIHKVGKWQTLRIERNNPTLRVNLKRLARRTLCFSRSVEMLEACLRIWFWG